MAVSDPRQEWVIGGKNSLAFQGTSLKALAATGGGSLIIRDVRGCDDYCPSMRLEHASAFGPWLIDASHDAACSSENGLTSPGSCVSGPRNGAGSVLQEHPQLPH